jgi:hypothetical protein
MQPGARTPEELDTLLEDAFVLHDGQALARLFGDGALLVPAGGLPPARGPEQIAGAAAAMWAQDRTYVADPRSVLEARETALVIGRPSISVMRRRRDGSWRYAVSLLDPPPHDRREQP